MKSIFKDIEVIDYMLTKEVFTLRYNSSLDIYQTEPIPDIDKLQLYYKSDDYISHTDSTKSFFDKLYQKIKVKNLKFKINLITKDQPYIETLLDIGCGTGDFLKIAQSKSIDVYGVEPSDKARSLAQKKILKPEHLYSKLEDISDKTFDVITLWHVLEHVPNYNDYLEKIKQLLKPNGSLIIAVPNFKSYDARFYKNFWAAYDVPRHLWHFSQASIKIISEQHQLKLIDIKPMWFDSFYVSLLSEKYRESKLSWLKAFLIGLFSNLKAVFSKEFSSLIYVIRNKY